MHMTTKGRINPQERAETLEDLRELLESYRESPLYCDEDERMQNSLRRAIEELEATDAATR